MIILFSLSFHASYIDDNSLRSRYTFIAIEVKEAKNKRIIQDLKLLAKSYPEGYVYEYIEVNDNISDKKEIIGLWSVDEYGELTGEFNPNKNFKFMNNESEQRISDQELVSIFDDNLERSEGMGGIPKTLSSMYNIVQWLNYHHRFDLTLKYSNKAYDIAIELEDQSLVVSITMQLGVTLYLMEKFDESFDSFMNVLNKLDPIEDARIYNRILKIIGLIYFENGTHEEMVKAFEKHKSFRDENLAEIELNQLITNNLIDGGIFLNERNINIRAFKYFEKALEYGKITNNKESLAEIYLNLGISNRIENKMEKALVYYQKCSEISRNEGYLSFLASSSNNIGYAYLIMKEFTKALDFMIEAVELMEHIEDDKGLSNCLLNLELIYRNMEMLEKVEETRTKYDEVLTRIQNKM